MGLYLVIQILFRYWTKFVFVPWHRAAILRRPWAGLWETLPKASMSRWGFEFTILHIQVERSTTDTSIQIRQSSKRLMDIYDCHHKFWWEWELQHIWTATIWIMSSYVILVISSGCPSTCHYQQNSYISVAAVDQPVIFSRVPTCH